MKNLFRRVRESGGVREKAEREKDEWEYDWDGAGEEPCDQEALDAELEYAEGADSQAEFEAGEYAPEEAEFEAGEYDPEEPEFESWEYDPEEAEFEAGEYDPEEPEFESWEYDPEEAEFEAGEYDPEEPEFEAEGYAPEAETYYAGEEAARAEGDYSATAEEPAADGSCYREADSREDEPYYGEEVPVQKKFYYEGEEPEGAGREEFKEVPRHSGIPKPLTERKQQTRGKRPGAVFLAKLGSALRSMDAMDRVMVTTGVAVLVMAVVTGAVFINFNLTKKQLSDFADVGRQLNGINLIGEAGLLAVANVQMAKYSGTAAQPEEESRKEYDETGYERDVAVEPDFTSVQKDLKIKFINRKNEKLVSNIPFSVTVTDPEGKSQIWSDDDMDGIIYKKDILPGIYEVAMEPLTDDKYADYTLFTDKHSVEVKKEIAYNKVNVANEVKKESEVNVAKEDTRKNETAVESALEDTVPWVESKVISATYHEVAKNTIPDPLTLSLARGALYKSGEYVAGTAVTEGQEARTGENGGEDMSQASEGQNPGEVEPSAAEPTAEPTQEPTAEPTQEPTAEPTQEPTAQPTQEPTAEPTQEPTAEPTQEPTAQPTQEPTAEPTQEPTAEPTQEPTAEPTQEPTAEPTQSPTAQPTQSPTAQPTQSPTAQPIQSPTAQPTQSPTAEPTNAPSQAPALSKGTVTVAPTELNGTAGMSMAAVATVSGFTVGQKVVYSVSSDNGAVAAATVDAGGNINVTALAAGTAVLTVTANYENGTAQTQAAATIHVKVVAGSRSMRLDKAAMTVYAQESAELQAEVINAFSDTSPVTAESSDTETATVSVNGRTVTVRGVAEGTAVITVRHVENGQEVSAACSVTVKKHPREDKITLLKDAKGQQIYVMEGSNYREAVMADYYTAGKFFIRGEAKYTGWQTLDGKVYYFTADGNKVTGEQVIQGAKYNFASDGALVTGNNGSQGIDVSKWNGTIDWNAVKNSGISFVIIRCGYRGSDQGKLIEDPKFETNIKGAAAAGLKVGVYFFSQAVDEVEAVEEASMVLDQISSHRISYPVFLDVEASGGRGDKIDKTTRTAVCRAFCQTIQNAGYTAGVYSNKVWLESRIDAGSLNAYKIWLAQYAASPTYKGRYDLWQYRSTGSVSGISGQVDRNISYLGY